MYYINTMETETTKQIIDRSWFIVNTLHIENCENKEIEQFKNTEKDSRIRYNKNVLNCKYPHDIDKRIIDLEDKIYV